MSVSTRVGGLRSSSAYRPVNARMARARSATCCQVKWRLKDGKVLDLRIPELVRDFIYDAIGSRQAGAVTSHSSAIDSILATELCLKLVYGSIKKKAYPVRNHGRKWVFSTPKNGGYAMSKSTETNRESQTLSSTDARAHYGLDC